MTIQGKGAKQQASPTRKSYGLCVRLSSCIIIINKNFGPIRS